MRDDLPSRNLMTAVVRLEKSRSPADLVRAMEALRKWRRSPRDDDLTRVFVDWVRRLMDRFRPAEEDELPLVRTLEETKMTLEERVSQWPAQWMREGLEQGLEHERALLRRMASSRFGTTTAEHLSRVLAGIADPERLAEVGDWLVRCDTGKDFLARVDATAAEPDPRAG